LNLRWSILGVIVMTFAGLVAILTFSLQTILVPHFRQEESRAAELNVQRVLGVMENERVSLSMAISNLASRDESIDFIQTGDPQYVQRNLNQTIMAGLNIDLLAFVTLQGGVEYAYVLPDAQGRADLPPELMEHLGSDGALLQGDSIREVRSGLIAAASGPMVVVSAPLLKTGAEGSAAGILLAGRSLTDDEINRIAGSVRFPLTLTAYDQQDMPEEMQVAKKAFTAEQSINSQTTSETQITGYALLKDIFGEPAYILRVEQGRSIFRSSRIVLQYLYTAMIMGMLLFSVMTYLALDRMALSRIRLLGREVTRIGKGGDLSARVTVAHRDELTRVGNEINGMLTNLQHLSHRLVEIQEDERRSIALELHDEIGQLLTGLKLQLGSTAVDGSEASQDSLVKARELADELIRKVRNLSLDLRPTMLDDLGLLPALLWHFDRYTSLTGIKVDFSQNGVNDRRFIPELESTAYRIIQEALTNVARHTSEKEVSVRVTYLDKLLTVQVEDRGSGFMVDKMLEERRSRGLRGMQERVALVGGSLTIDSVAGWGTSILVEIPAEALMGEGSEDDHSTPGG